MFKNILLLLLLLSLLLTSCVPVQQEQLVISSENLELGQAFIDLRSRQCYERIEKQKENPSYYVNGEYVELNYLEAPISFNLEMKMPQQYNSQDYRFSCYNRVDGQKFDYEYDRETYGRNNVWENLPEGGSREVGFDIFEDHFLEVCCKLKGYAFTNTIPSDEVCKTTLVKKACVR